MDTYNIINYALKSNKIVFVPKVINKNEGMKALKINNLEEMIKSNYGILEPWMVRRKLMQKKLI